MVDHARKTEQELADEFYMMAGQCISEWAATDDVLFLLCHRVLQCAVEHAAIVYFRTPTLDARLTLVSDLIRSVIPKPRRDGEHAHPDQKTWDKIADDFRDLLSMRNRIAHEPVWPTFRAGYDEEFQAHRIFISGFELYASAHERSRGRAEKPPLRIDELRSHLFATNQIAGRIQGFRHDILPAHIQAFVSQFPMPASQFPMPSPPRR
jgi:hypothetical protein